MTSAYDTDPSRPAGDDGPSPTHRILVITASAGAGHNRPARELARRFAGLGHHVQVTDLADTAPFGRTMRRAFRRMLTSRPALWGRMCSSFDDTGELPAVLRRLLVITGRRVARIIDQGEIDLIVSTYPLGGRVVGQARLHTARRPPLVTYVTDPAIHSLWIDAVTDQYLTTWTFAGAHLRRMTPTPSAVVAAATGEQFRLDGAIRPDRAAGQPGRPLALVASGSWGVGDVIGTVRDLLADGRFRPVVVCGRNADLRARVGAIPGAVALGWIDDMAALMRECSIAVLNSGGLTLAEATAVGLPVVHHKPLPGQGELNAAACQAGGGSPVSRSTAELSRALGRARCLGELLGTADPVAAILAVLDERRTAGAAA